MAEEIKAWQVLTGTSVDDIVKLQDVGGGTPGLPAINASQVLSLNASELLSGTIPDARVAQSNVTQHESSLTISFSQMSDSINDGQVPQSAVTQHEDALAVDLPQLTQGTASDGQVLAWNNSAGEWQPQNDTDTRTDVSDNGTLVVSAVTDVNFSTNLSVTDDTDGTVTVDATDTNTQTDVSDSGTTVVSSVADINFSSYLNVTDDTDGTVTVNVPSTGIDSNVVTGTAGTSGNLVEWNADGDAVDSGTATSNVATTSLTQNSVTVTASSSTRIDNIAGQQSSSFIAWAVGSNGDSGPIGSGASSIEYYPIYDNSTGNWDLVLQDNSGLDNTTTYFVLTFT